MAEELPFYSVEFAAQTYLLPPFLTAKDELPYHQRQAAIASPAWAVVMGEAPVPTELNEASIHQLVLVMKQPEWRTTPQRTSRLVQLLVMTEVMHNDLVTALDVLAKHAVQQIKDAARAEIIGLSATLGQRGRIEPIQFHVQEQIAAAATMLHEEGIQLPRSIIDLLVVIRDQQIERWPRIRAMAAACGTLAPRHAAPSSVPPPVDPPAAPTPAPVTVRLATIPLSRGRVAILDHDAANGYAIAMETTPTTNGPRRHFPNAAAALRALAEMVEN